MASTASTPLSISSSSALINANSKAAPPRLQPASLCVGAAAAAPTPHAHLATAYSRNVGRNVAAMATGEARAEVVSVGATETPEIVKQVQEAWDKVEDKYAVSSLAVAAGVGLVAAAGVISAIDKLPLIPGVLELVGIGYTGWFAYKNLASKTSRDTLIQKIKGTYNDIIGSS